MMKDPVLVIGDLHGKYEVAKLALDSNYWVVFLGDYVDAYNTSVEEQIETLRLVLNAVDQGRAVGLKGNHEMSYLKDGMQCSGFRAETLAHIRHMNTDLLLDFYWCEDFLLTHAGVSQHLLEYRGETIQEYLDSGEFFDIGASRGGRSAYGGLFWSDWRFDFKPVPGVNQIFGHTRGQDIRCEDNNWCIDCLDYTEPKGLLIEDGTAKEFVL